MDNRVIRMVMEASVRMEILWRTVGRVRMVEGRRMELMGMEVERRMVGIRLMVMGREVCMELLRMGQGRIESVV